MPWAMESEDENMAGEYTALFDYQEFCELLDHIQDLKLMASQNKSEADVYRKKIDQVCGRVERDFNDNKGIFRGWVYGEPIRLQSGQEVILNGDRKVIFVLLILNRRKELGLPLFQSDVVEFQKLCKQAKVAFPESYFTGSVRT